MGAVLRGSLARRENAGGGCGGDGNEPGRLERTGLHANVSRHGRGPAPRASEVEDRDVQPDHGQSGRYEKSVELRSEVPAVYDVLISTAARVGELADVATEFPEVCGLPKYLQDVGGRCAGGAMRRTGQTGLADGVGMTADEACAEDGRRGEVVV